MQVRNVVGHNLFAIKDRDRFLLFDSEPGAQKFNDQCISVNLFQETRTKTIRNLEGAPNNLFGYTIQSV